MIFNKKGACNKSICVHVLQHVYQ